jgi:hypothetical protein
MAVHQRVKRLLSTRSSSVFSHVMFECEDIESTALSPSGERALEFGRLRAQPALECGGLTPP